MWTDPGLAANMKLTCVLLEVFQTCGCPQRAPRAASSEHAPTRSRWGTRKTVRRSDRAPRRTAARAQDCSSRLLGRAGRRRWPTRRRRPALTRSYLGIRRLPQAALPKLRSATLVESKISSTPSTGLDQSIAGGKIFVSSSLNHRSKGSWEAAKPAFPFAGSSPSM